MPSAAKVRPTPYRPEFCPDGLSTIMTTTSDLPSRFMSATATPQSWLSHVNQPGTGTRPPAITPNSARPGSPSRPPDQGVKIGCDAGFICRRHAADTPSAQAPDMHSATCLIVRSQAVIFDRLRLPDRFFHYSPVVMSLTMRHRAGPVDRRKPHTRTIRRGLRLFSCSSVWRRSGHVSQQFGHDRARCGRWARAPRTRRCD
jgi:hypothetical protein